jgi:hypothetical protein
VAGWSCSTFPIIERDNQSRQLKEPFTSFFAMDLSINRHTCVLTIGCNYGQKAMESSLTACTAFLMALKCFVLAKPVGFYSWLQSCETLTIGKMEVPLFLTQTLVKMWTFILDGDQ